MNNHTHARAVRGTVSTLAALVLLLGTVVLAAPATADGTDPVLTLGTSRVAVDGNLQVNGSGFAPGASVDVQVCGVPGPDGLFQCSTGVEDAVVSPAGSFTENFVVKAPTGKCPCVVKVAAVDRPPVTVPVELVGHPVADRVQTPQLVVDTATLEGGGLLSFFTGSASGELVVTLRNAGVAPAEPTFQLTSGKADGSGVRTAVNDPGSAAIPPAGTAEARIPVSYGGLLGGDYSVTGYVVVGDIYAPVHVKASMRPWGLYALGLLLVVGGVAYARTRLAGGRHVPAATPHRTSGSRPGSQTSSRPSAASRPLPVRSGPRPLAPLAGGTSVASDPIPTPVVRPRTGALHIAEAARAAADAGRAVAAAAIEKARAAEAREAAVENEVARSESTAATIDARLDALAHDNFARPARPQVAQRAAEPVVEEPAVPERRTKRSSSRRSRRNQGTEMVGPPRLAETPIDRSLLKLPAEAVAQPVAEPFAQPVAVPAQVPVPVSTAADETDTIAGGDASDAVTAYLRATSPQTLETRAPRIAPAVMGATTGPLPVVAPAPLDLPSPPPSGGPGHAGPARAELDPFADLGQERSEEMVFSVAAPGTTAAAAPAAAAPVVPPASTSSASRDRRLEANLARLAANGAAFAGVESNAAFLATPAKPVTASIPAPDELEPITFGTPAVTDDLFAAPAAQAPAAQAPAPQASAPQAPAPQPPAPQIEAVQLRVPEAPAAQPPVIAPEQTGAPTMAELLRSRTQQRDRAMIVGGALDAIRVHTEDAPARLPDPHEYVPAPRDHRAPRGGKRAAR